MDLVMFFYILKLPKNTIYTESGNPDEFVLISDSDLANKKSIYLHLAEVKDYKVEDYIFTDFKRFEITKTSFIILILFIGLGLLTTIL